MSKPLSSFPESERERVAKRRASASTTGLGQLSAEDYLAKKAKKKEKKAP